MKNNLFSILVLFSFSTAMAEEPTTKTYHMNDIKTMQPEKTEGQRIEVYSCDDYRNISDATPYLKALLFDLRYQQRIFGSHKSINSTYRETTDYKRKMQRIINLSWDATFEYETFKKWLSLQGWAEASMNLVIRSDDEHHRCGIEPTIINNQYLVVIYQENSERVAKYAYAACGNFGGCDSEKIQKEAVLKLAQVLVKQNQL